jgi:hypothetical protein
MKMGRPAVEVIGVWQWRIQSFWWSAWCWASVVVCLSDNKYMFIVMKSFITSNLNVVL